MLLGWESRLATARREIAGCPQGRPAVRGSRGRGRERVRGRCAGGGSRAVYAHKWGLHDGQLTPPTPRFARPRASRARRAHSAGCYRSRQSLTQAAARRSLTLPLPLTVADLPIWHLRERLGSQKIRGSLLRDLHVDRRTGGARAYSPRAPDKSGGDGQRHCGQDNEPEPP